MSDRFVDDDDLRLFYLMHRAMRADLARLPRAVAALEPGAVARMEGIARWLSFVERTIAHHHHGEDTWLYPTIESRDPSFTVTRRALEADHHGLDPALGAARRGLAALRARSDAGEGAAFRSERDALVLHLDALRDHMRRHLDDEEAAVVPRAKALIRKREIEAFERESGRSISLGDMALILPWVRSFADAREQAMIDAVLPWPVRLLYRFSWRAKYERLASALAAPSESAADEGMRPSVEGGAA